MEYQAAFRPHARLLLLLGDELIKTPMLAVFELIKNSYDADASIVDINFSNLDSPDAEIVIQDNGEGMDKNTIENIWLEPGNNYRLQEINKEIRTKIYNRLPLGGKGVGRFAIHKLGEEILMVTRKKDQPEFVVRFSWANFESNNYMDNINITYIERDPELFKDSAGTIISIRRLRTQWNTKELKKLYNSVLSILSPFKELSDFTVNMNINPRPQWLDNVLTIKKLKDIALHKISGNCEEFINKNGEKWIKIWFRYLFSPYPRMKTLLKPRYVSRTVRIPGQLKDLTGIGRFDFRFYIFDRDQNILDLGVENKTDFKEFMDENGGIRVFREGIRVFSYGEKGYDWLGLDQRRINDPTKRISNNVILGGIFLRYPESLGLVEKTNREGFIENECYDKFITVIKEILINITAERNIDKQKIREVYSKQKQKEPVLGEIQELRDKLLNVSNSEDLIKSLATIERQYIDVKNVLLNAAQAGMGFSLAIHEVEKGINLLKRTLESDFNLTELKEIVNQISIMIDGMTALLKGSGKKKESLDKIVRMAIDYFDLRAKFHKIDIKFINKSSHKCNIERRLVISAILNILDNSIYWIEAKGGKRGIMIEVNSDSEYVYVILSDTGTGFIDMPEYITQPFFSRKSHGMGLGLYLVDEIMKAHQGKLEFLSHNELSESTWYDGAIVKLSFRRVE